MSAQLINIRARETETHFTVMKNFAAATTNEKFGYTDIQIYRFGSLMEKAFGRNRQLVAFTKGCMLISILCGADVYEQK